MHCLTLQPCCCSVPHPTRVHSRRLARRQLLTRAAQEDGRSNEQRSKQEQNQSPWDEHLSTQEKQADRYRPPLVTGLDIQVSRGKFLGRLAILILGAVLLGERITGKGAIEQFEISETGVPLWEIEPLLGAAVIGLIVAAFWPSSDRPKKASLFGRVQKLSGRFACLGLASTITAEVVSGKGALALLNVETGIDSVSEVEAVGAFIVMLLLTEDLGQPRQED